MPIRPHAFVAMPFGPKPGPDGTEVNYNRIYSELIAPAIEAAGLSAFRADQEQAAGSILADMFQELLVSDLVVADLSIPNPNVWYELGVRHALRARGVVLLFGGKSPSAFDLYTDRKLRYQLAGGGPDPATLEADKGALTNMIRATMKVWHGEKISPVYYHVPNLLEPDWKTLRVGKVRKFWDRHDAWMQQIDLARQHGRIGDLLVLADEGPVAALRADAWIIAGIALRRSGEFELALEYLKKGLEIEPAHLPARRELGMCLQRLGKAGASGHSTARARSHYKAILKDHPLDVETWALLGRLDKDDWTATWRTGGNSAKQNIAAAKAEVALLKSAIKSYENAYRADPRHYFSGINAIALARLGTHLGVLPADKRREVMAGAVRFAAENEAQEKERYWAAVTLGDLEVMEGKPLAVTQAYETAVAFPGLDRFSLQSSREQLLLLKDLAFRPQAVAAGIKVFDRALGRLQQSARPGPVKATPPRQVLLFSGHVMDSPTRETPRFPPAAEALAAKAIANALEELGAGPEDVALCQAAAGGDLLFLEACKLRGLRCEVLLPFPEPEFVKHSVRTAADSLNGATWQIRYYQAIGTAAAVRVMPVELGDLPEGVDPFERCNLWLLYTALAMGLPKVRFVALWNGAGGDGPGGTAHMVSEVERLTGRVHWLDTRKIFKTVLQP